MAVGDDDVIDEAVVKIRPDLDGFGKKLQADVDRATRGVQAKIKLVADRTGFAASIKEKVLAEQRRASQPTIKVKLRASRDGFGASIRLAVTEQQALKNQPTYKVKVVADARGLRSTVGGVGGDGKLSDRANADTEARYRSHQERMDHLHQQAIAQDLQRTRSFNERVAATEITALREKAEREVKSLRDSERRERESNERRRRSRASTLESLTPPKLIDFGGEGIRPNNLLIASLAALSPLLISVSSSALQAGSSIAALGAAGIGAGAAITGLVVGFQGVVQALKLRQTVNKQNLAASSKDNAGALADATDSLINAQEGLRKAQRDELAAQLDVNQARKTAVRDLQDLRRAVIDLRNEERGDRVTLAEAKDKAKTTGRNFFASALQKARANQDVRDAQTQLGDTIAERNRKKDDLADSVRKGVSGSDALVAARNQAKDATDARKRAQRQLADSKRDLKAAATGTTATTTSMSDLEQRLKDMSPAARELYNWFVDNDAILKKLRRTIEQGVLPGFTRFLTEVNKGAGKQKGTSSLELFATAAARLGGKIGDLAGDLGEITRQKFFRRDFNKIIDANATAMDKLSGAVKILIKPFLTIFRASAPLLVRFSAYIETIASRFAAFIDDADRSGKLTTFFQRSGDELGRWADLASQVLRFLKGIFTATLPSGTTIVTKLTEFFKGAADYTNSEKGQNSIRSFFDKLSNLPFKDIARVATELTALFLTMHAARFAAANPFFAALGTVLASNPEEGVKLLDAVTAFVGGTVKYLADHPGVFEGLLAVFAAAKLSKTAKLALSIPGITSLRGFLTSKFKPLEKLLGGGSSVATMTVHAGVVNILGGGGSVGGLPGTVKNGARAGEGLAAEVAALSAPEVVAIIGAVAGSAIEAYTGTRAGQNGDGIFKPVLRALKDPSFGNILSAAFSVSLISEAAYGIGKFQAWWMHRDDNQAPLKREQDAYKQVARDAFGHRISKDKPNDDKDLQAYIDARRESVRTVVEQERNAHGDTAANKLLQDETKRSVTTLSTLLQVSGWSAAEADKYSAAVYNVGAMSNKSNSLVKTFTQSVKDSAQKAYDATNATGTFNAALDKIPYSVAPKIAVPGTPEAIEQINTLWDALKGIDGNWVSHLSTSKYAYVAGQLKALLASQFVANGSSPDLNEANRELGHFFASGGHVRGPGGPRDDRIPAMLSNGEYVLRAKAVKAIGVDRLDRANTMQFADGGIVGKVKAAANASTNQRIVFDTNPFLTGVDLFAGNGVGGSVVGNAKVAEVAEATARAMGATDKQLIALIEAGIVESNLSNLNYGDRDSLGFLQQRSSWGTAKQRTNVAYATRAFINAARRVDNPDFSAGQLAQAVQISAFPDRYPKQLANAVAVLNARAPYLTGFTPLDSYSGPIPKGLGKVAGLTPQMLAAVIDLKRVFPFETVTSGLRNTTTVSGNPSLHNSGRAADVLPSMEVFNYLYAKYASRAKELIYSPAGERQVKNGQPHYYTGAVRDEHFNHIHLALKNGGLVPQRTYDSGGGLPPGYTLAYNGTGRTETVRTAGQEKALSTSQPMRLDRRDIVLLAQHIAAAASPTVHMDGRKVAEITNQYTYLPAGV